MKRRIANLLKVLSALLLFVLMGCELLEEPRGRLNLEVPEGYWIYVDGEKRAEAGTGYTQLLLEPGDRVITLKNERKEKCDEELNVFIGEGVSVSKSMTCSIMVFLRGGTFQMGSADGRYDEQPVHSVRLSPFFIDQTEVTVKAYRACVQAEDCDKPYTDGEYFNYDNPARDDHSVNGVGWHNAHFYCLSVGKRLPTEAEWEYAATWKNGIKYKYPSGEDDIYCSTAVIKADGDGCGKYRTWPVASKSKEINGTYDMSGNVWEWVRDGYVRDYYANSAKKNPRAYGGGDSRVVRGAGWLSRERDGTLTGTSRFWQVPFSKRSDLGFRCARDAN